MSVLIKTTPTYVPADKTQQKQVSVTAGGTVYYSTTSDTNAEDTAIELGKNATITAGQYFISASTSKVRVEDVPSPTFTDLTVTDDLAVAGTVTATEGVASSSAVPGFYTWQPPTAESGTDTAFAEKKLFTASIFIPCNKTIKGIGYLLGAGGGTNKVIVALFNSAGTKVANTSETTEGTVAGTEKQSQEIDLTATYAAKGPGVFFIGITANGATAKLRTIPAYTAGSNILAKEISLATKNVVPASITAPTAWTAAVGPVAWIY